MGDDAPLIPTTLPESIPLAEQTQPDYEIPKRNESLARNRSKDISASKKNTPSDENGTLQNSNATAISREADHGSFNSFLVFSVFISCLGMFQFGYHIAELNGIQDYLSCKEIPATAPPTGSLPACIPLGQTEFSVITALFSAGGLVGALAWGPLSDKVGRKQALLYSTMLLAISPILLGLSVNFAMLLMGRFMAGCGAGSATTITPMYLNEISPLKLRGVIGSMGQINLVTGLFLAGLLGNFLYEPPFWRLSLGLPIIPCIISLICIPFLVESPKYLASKSHSGSMDLALAALTKLRGNNVDPAALKAEIESWKFVAVDGPKESNVNVEAGQSNLPEDEDESQVGLLAFMKARLYRNSLITLLLIHASQQFSGISPIFAYTFNILTLFMSPSTSRTFTIFISLYNVIVTVICGLLLDRLGRRKLLLTSVTIMGIGMLVVPIGMIVSVGGLAFTGVVLVITGFAIGMGNIPFVLIGELVDVKAIGSASTVALTANWLSQFIVVLVFLPLLSTIKYYAFLIFAGYLFISGTLTAIYLVESKGKTSVVVLNEMSQRGFTNGLKAWFGSR
ncbi:general substrate transporter [Paraphysoderma sedebokerense]|nr:general substrate transporter [Paraphysoderma sedebokerense]